VIAILNTAERVGVGPHAAAETTAAWSETAARATNADRMNQRKKDIAEHCGESTMAANNQEKKKNKFGEKRYTRRKSSHRAQTQVRNSKARGVR
jgi:hypothetical protein